MKMSICQLYVYLYTYLSVSAYYMYKCIFVCIYIFYCKKDVVD